MNNNAPLWITDESGVEHYFRAPAGDFVMRIMKELTALREEIARLRTENAALRAALEELRDGKDEPEYHAQGLGCGVEDRDIVDRYDAAAYGWDSCQERYQEWITIVVNDVLSPQDAKRGINPSPDPGERATAHESAGKGESTA